MTSLRNYVLPLILCWSSAVLADDFTTLKGHGGPIMGLAVSANGHVASASFDNSVGLWTDNSPTWLDAHDAAVVDVVFLPDGRLASGGDDFAVWLWDGAQGTELGRHKGKVTDLAVSPDGRLLASASWGGRIGLWSLIDDTQHRFLGQIDSGFNDVAFSHDGRLLYASTSSGVVFEYDLNVLGTPKTLIRHGFAINEMVVAPTGQWLAFGSVDGVVHVIDTATGAVQNDFTLERRPILAMSFDPKANRLAFSDGQGYITIIDAQNWKIDRDFRATRAGPVWALAFSRDGQTIWAGGLDDVVYGWPIDLLDRFDPVSAQDPTFLRNVSDMPNGERQFMRKCSICHALTAGESRKAGPTLYALFGRSAGTVEGYRYSSILHGSPIVWSVETIDGLFDQGPDYYIPGSKMPMQRITRSSDRQDLIDFLRIATAEGD